MSESAVQTAVRLEAARKGIYLWRNNVGAAVLDNGSYIRWGLANDSKKANELLKSGDLVGLRQRLILPSDVGHYIGQFISRECKPEGWTPTDDERYQAQVRWMNLINYMGGDAAIVTGPGSL